MGLTPMWSTKFGCKQPVCLLETDPAADPLATREEGKKVPRDLRCEAHYLGLEPYASLLVKPCLEKSKEDMGLPCAEAARVSNGCDVT